MRGKYWIWPVYPDSLKDFRYSRLAKALGIRCRMTHPTRGEFRYWGRIDGVDYVTKNQKDRG